MVPIPAYDDEEEGGALSEANRIVRATLDSLSAQIALVDASGEIFLTNEAWKRFARANGTPPHEVSEGANYLDVCDAAGSAGSEDAAALADGLRSVLDGRIEEFAMEYPCHSPTEKRWFVARATRFLAGDVAEGAVVAHEDITERKLAEETLHESEERLRLAAEAARLGHWEFVPETGELHGDGAFNAHHGAPPDARLDLEGFLRAVHPDGRGAVRRRLAAALEQRDGYGAQYRVALPDGAIRWVYSRGRFVEGAGSGPDRLVGVALDVTARRELEGERERARARGLAARAEAAERGRISRELHDRVAHDMVVAHQSLQLHAAYAPSDPPRAAEKLEQAAEATKAALDQTRDLSAQLARSGARETRHGLGAALRDLLAAHAPPGVETALSVAGDESSVPTKVGEQAYLVMREAVRNAVAHSGCSRIGVSLEIRDGELVGRVEDDGAGFDPRDDPDGRRGDGWAAAFGGEGAPRAGVGLGSMRERTGLLGGRLDIHSEPGRGTAVEVRAPLEG